CQPRSRVAQIDSGWERLPLLFQALEKARKSSRAEFGEHPHEALRRQVWVSLHFEEDKRVAADLLGIDRVLMGSDWPHAEGLPQPADYAAEARRDGFDGDALRRLMRDNALAMLGL